MREGGHRALKGACVENPREETTFRKKAASPLHHAIGWRRSGSKAFKHCKKADTTPFFEPQTLQQMTPEIINNHH